jgi:hypothetical protein
LEFTQYKVDYETALLNLVENSYAGVQSKQEPRNRLYTYLSDNKGFWISLEDYFKTENTKGTIYLTSDIEAIYTNQAWYKTHHDNGFTYLGVPDDNGNLIKKELPKENEAISSFFE